MGIRARWTRRAGATFAIAAISVGAAACGSSSSGGTPPPTATSSSTQGAGGNTSGSFEHLAINGGGTPYRGGILNVLGQGDVDFMDPNITYYTVGYTVARAYSRQLYTYPAIEGKQTQVVPDLATAMPTVSDGGKQYTVTIKKGAMWNTNPPTQVTGADEVRGIETTCNPSEPFGGLPDFEPLIKGMTAFCAGFAKVQPTASAITAYENSHSIPGVQASKSNPLQVTFTLNSPATYFTDILAIPATSPRSAAMDAYVPASATEAQHTVSDGPYEIQSYDPTKSITLVRNPDWSAATDSVRKAYVNQIDVTETGTQDSNQQQLETNSPSADVTLDVGPSPIQANELLEKNDPDLNVESAVQTNPYIIFNTQSPNNGGALKQVAVRQAISYAISRAQLDQDNGGVKLSPPLTHILPPGIDGSPPPKDYYPFNDATAKADLAKAGVHNMTLTFLYRSSEDVAQNMFQTVQANLKAVGITLKPLGVPDAAFFTKYLEQPSVARKGTWDLALSSWGPDWYGNAALSFFYPLFDGKILPPSSSNFGLYNDPKVDTLITKAATAPSLSVSNKLWAEADNDVMNDAAIFPITDPNTPDYHGSQVHNAIYIPNLNQFDWTNLWLTPSESGG